MMLPFFWTLSGAVLLAAAGGRQIAGPAARFARADLHHDKGLKEGMKITRFGIDRHQPNLIGI